MAEEQKTDPKKQIPFDQMTDEEKKALQAFPPGTAWTEAKRQALNKINNIEEIKDLKDDESPGFFDGIKKSISENIPWSDDDDKKKEKDKLEEDAKEDKIRLNHQAFLMFNHESLTAQSVSESDRFKYFAQIDHPEPAEINNILFKKPIEYDILLNSKSAYLSYFVPKIRIFKEYTVSLDEVIDIELPIYQQYRESDFQSIFTNKEGRGGGVGIKSFNWNSLGNSQGNKFTFGAELELFFESIGEISKVRSVNIVGGKTIQTSFEDLLIQKIGSAKNPQGGVYDPDYYRIKAEVGWSIPPNNTGLVPQKMIEEIKYSNLIFYMTLHSHELDIADDSTVTLKLKYTAYIETITDSPKNSNIFYPQNESYESQVEGRREVIEDNKDKLQGDQNKGIEPIDGLEKQKTEEVITEAEDQIKDLQNKNKIEVYQRILSYIYAKKFIRFVIAKQEDIQKFTSIISRPKNLMTSQDQIDSFKNEVESIKNNNIKKTGTTSFDVGPKLAIDNEKPEELGKSINSTTKVWDEELIKAAKGLESEVVIPYFYLGDLIDAILQDMYNGNSATPKSFFEKQIKLLLGPVIFYDYGRLQDKVVIKPADLNSRNKDGTKIQEKVYTGSKTVINIADVPLSLDIYNAWFTKKIVDAGVVNMSLKDFISNIINDLVIRAVGQETFSFAPRQKTRLVYKTKTLRKNPNRFSTSSSPTTNPASFSQAASTSQNSLPSTLRFPATSLKLYDDFVVEQEKTSLDNFMLIYSISDQQFELISDYEMDKKRGIRHIVYGAETGLIKTIKFSRQDNPLIRSHNMKLASQQNSEKSIILREVYNASIEMYGNSLFEIGELLYVSPTLFGSSTSVDFVKNLGIGGYFMILKINNSIEDGSFKTNLDIKWNARGDGVPLQNNDGLIK